MKLRRTKNTYVYNITCMVVGPALEKGIGNSSEMGCGTTKTLYSGGNVMLSWAVTVLSGGSDHGLVDVRVDFETCEVMTM